MRILSLLLFFMVSPTFAAEPFASGVAVGKRPGPYSFLVATGPQRGQSTCYICEQKEKPAAIVFARTLSEPLGKLLIKLDGQATAKKDDGFKVWMTQLTDTADLDPLAKWGQKQGLKSIAIGAFEDADGPPAYVLHRDADITVLMFVREKVTANFAFKLGELNDDKIAKVLEALPKLFEKK